MRRVHALPSPQIPQESSDRNSSKTQLERRGRGLAAGDGAHLLPAVPLPGAIVSNCSSNVERVCTCVHGGSRGGVPVCMGGGPERV